MELTQIQGRNGVPLHTTDITPEYPSRAFRKGSMRLIARRDFLFRWDSWISSTAFQTSSEFVNLNAAASAEVRTICRSLIAVSKRVFASGQAIMTRRVIAGARVNKNNCRQKTKQVKRTWLTTLATSQRVPDVHAHAAGARDRQYASVVR